MPTSFDPNGYEYYRQLLSRYSTYAGYTHTTTESQAMPQDVTVIVYPRDLNRGDVHFKYDHVEGKYYAHSRVTSATSTRYFNSFSEMEMAFRVIFNEAPASNRIFPQISDNINSKYMKLKLTPNRCKFIKDKIIEYPVGADVIAIKHSSWPNGYIISYGGEEVYAERKTIKAIYSHANAIAAYYNSHMVNMPRATIIPDMYSDDYHRLASRQAIEEDGIQTGIINLRTYRDITYPDIMLPDTFYVSFHEASNKYLVKYSGVCGIHQFNVPSLFDARLKIGGILNRNNINVRDGNVHPRIDGDDWNTLHQAKADYMRLSSVNRPETDFEYTIKWLPDRGVYVVKPPSYNPVGHEQDFVATIEAAYLIAIDFCKYAKRSYNFNFSVKPHKLSKAYADLVKASTLKAFNNNPSSIHTRARLKADWKYIIAYPEAGGTSDKIREVVKHMAWKVYGDFKWSKPSNYARALNSVGRALKGSLGIEFVNCYDRKDTLIHPKLAVLCTTDAVVLTKISVTKQFFLSEGMNCPNCNDAHLARNMININGVYICPGCVNSQGYYKCTMCHGTYHQETEGCPHFNNMPSSTIFNYSQDVRAVIPRMYSVDTDKVKNGTMLRYGLELEVIARDNNVELAADKVGPSLKHHAIMKKDSSLGEHGFEIVTVPATLEYHKKELWNKFFDIPDSSGKTPANYTYSWASTKCGLHIHLTKDALDKMQLSKLLVFYHDVKNNTFLTKIAGRTVGEGARYCFTRNKKLGAKRILGYDGKLEGMDLSTINSCRDHHEAITISARNKGKTAEVRIFRGNATKHGIMRALEFVDATVLWCAENGATELNYKNFLKWFSSPSIKSRYPDLRKQLISLGYLPSRRLSKLGVDHDLVPDEKRTA